MQGALDSRTILSPPIIHLVGGFFFEPALYMAPLT
jgi:hypothetical protein